MRIGLVSYRCRNRDLAFNLSQIERAMREARGKADLLCFGEAFLQGFDSLVWKYETDTQTAVSMQSVPIQQIRQWTLQYGVSLLTGYIEKDSDRLYSSCLVLAEGEIVQNYRRISKGWKEYSKTDGHYCEGTEVKAFTVNGTEMMLALCGDLWDFPDCFRTNQLLVWPVYVGYTPEEWENGVLQEYAGQAALAAETTVMINPLDDNPRNYGGAFVFQKGKVVARTAFDREQILYTDV